VCLGGKSPRHLPVNFSKFPNLYPICSVKTAEDAVKPQPVDDRYDEPTSGFPALLIGKPPLVDSRSQRA
jgi:hypothetical protein